MRAPRFLPARTLVRSRAVVQWACAYGDDRITSGCTRRRRANFFQMQPAVNGCRIWGHSRGLSALLVPSPAGGDAGGGATPAAARRLEALAAIPVLSVSRGVTTL